MRALQFSLLRRAYNTQSSVASTRHRQSIGGAWDAHPNSHLEYSITSGQAGTIGTGLKTEYRFPEGTEAIRSAGARHDSPEMWRKLHIWLLQFPKERAMLVPTLGMLKDDKRNDQEWGGYFAKAKIRLTNEEENEYMIRHWRTTPLETSARYVMKDEYRPNVDANHYYLSVGHGTQLRCEYEERRMVDSVTGSWMDAFHKCREYFWFFPTRAMQIYQQKQRASKDMTVNPITGQLEAHDTIATAFSKSAF